MSSTAFSLAYRGERRPGAEVKILTVLRLSTAALLVSDREFKLAEKLTATLRKHLVQDKVSPVTGTQGHP